MRYLFKIAPLAGWVLLVIFPACSQKSGNRTATMVDSTRLEQLLTRPVCLETFNPDAPDFTVEEVSIPSGDIQLYGELYLPANPGKHPAMVLMQGGGNNPELLASGPRFHARRMAQCGIAALTYHKRGTGKSGGVFQESTFDDFIRDAGNAANWLAKDERIDPDHIGVYGGSEGGRLAPLAAVRFPVFSLAISASGPIGEIADQATFNMNYALRVRGHPDSVVDEVMPLWRRHHAAWAEQDREEMKLLAEEVTRLRERYDPLVLPSTEEEILTDPGLYFLRPTFNSMCRDYLSELAQLRVPWLAMYGELDPIVNVQESIQNIEQQIKQGRNPEVEIVLIEDVGHSFFNAATREWVHNEYIVLNWLAEKIRQGEKIHG